MPILRRGEGAGRAKMQRMADSEQPVAKFETSLEDLERTVRELEAGDLPLERSLELFERGVGLSELCRKQLEGAETRVESLVRRGNKTTAEPFLPTK
jgi:exodeoxyribonuclease VII small subunit